MKANTLRFRMMLLFCTVVGVLLAGSYLAFWVLLAREVSAQIDRQLLETARPIVADLITDAIEQDVNELNLPGEYFELLNETGRVLQRSRNVRDNIDFKWFKLTTSKPVFGLAGGGHGHSLRAALIPFRQGGQWLFLAVAIPTHGINRVLDSFGRIALLLFPLSLLLTAAISTLYVGRSLAPLTALRQHAALMAKRVSDRNGFWTPLPVASRHDELGRLAETFNELLQGVDSALRQLRQFVTDASHELRTPLAVLRGETELLLAKPRSADEYRKTILALDAELRKLTRIVEGLFTLSMADAGQLRLASEPLYINEVLEDACTLVDPRARAKGVAIERELKREIAYSGDEAFLHELFLIFLDNAIKYSAAGTSVRVSIENKDDNVCARFQDEGIGIPAEHLPRIFERFYRAASTSNGDSQSGGLGLAIALAIARAHGGSIECESSPGAGSSFSVTLPVQQIVEKQFVGPRKGGAFSPAASMPSRKH